MVKTKNEGSRRISTGVLDNSLWISDEEIFYFRMIFVQPSTVKWQVVHVPFFNTSILSSVIRSTDETLEQFN